jgi:hypothetical protein
MAGRPSVASLDSGAESPEYSVESPMAGRRASAAEPLRSGSGGRWLPWPMRVLPRAAILIVGYRGVSSIVRNERPSTASAGNGAAAASAPSFPVMLAAAYSLQFGQVYLNSSPGNVTERANELAAFIPANVSALQPEFGWTGAGTMQLESEQVAGIDVRSAHTAVVAVIATIIGRLAELGVPTFSRAYAGGSQATLNRFLAPGASVGGLGGAVGFESIGSLMVPPGGATRGNRGSSQLGAVWPGQPCCPAVRCNLRHVGHRSAARKMVCKGDPCIYAADGDPMTWFTSPLVVPCGGIPATEGARRPAPGLRHPGQLTDVHGREG